MVAKMALPTGDNITFLFTDIEGSTTLLRSLGDDGYRQALEEHAGIVRKAIAAQGGTEVATEGDAFFVVFADARKAIAAVVETQRRLAEHAWPPDAPIRVRMGVHTGQGLLGGDNYMGLDVHKAARIASAGHGGQVLVSDRTRELVGEQLEGGVKLLNLGEHRLKDFPQDERVFQLNVPGLPADFPPLRAVGRNNLPAQLTPFIGREPELERAHGFLSDGRLLTLTGPGGTGKTRFAIETASRARYDFLDGAYFVALAPVTDPELVPMTIADALEIKLDPGRPALEVVKAHLAIKDLLLVLDNLEQVLPAASAISELVKDTTRLKVLATSREALHISGEQELPVPPLAAPSGDGAPDPKALERYEAVTLFVQRARSASPDFTLTAGNARAVADITSRLDGLPLAIELAAARIKVLAPEGILQRLESSLTLLKSASVDLPARQQTLRNTIAWSYDLLTNVEKALFRRLGVFVRGFTIASTEAVVAEGLDHDILDGVGSLVDKNLVRRYEGEHGEERFHMLETIREYALEQLRDSGEEDQVAARHLAYFLALAQEAAPQLMGEEQPTWMDRLDHEHDNLRAALSWAGGNDMQSGLALGGALWRFWHFRGHLQEARDRLEGLLAQPQAAEPTAARAAALDGLAGIIYWIGDYARARQLYLEVLEIWRATGDRDREFEALNSIGDSLSMGGDAQAALPFYKQGLEIAEGSGNEFQMGYAAAEVGSAMAFSGDIAGAKPHLAKALAAAEKFGAKFFVMIGHYMNGWVATRERGFDLAYAEYLRQIEIAEELGDRTGVALALNGLADLAIDENKLPRALRLAGAAEAIREQVGGGAPPESMRARDPRIAAAGKLSPDEVKRAWDEGRAMPYEEAVGYARARAGETAPGEGN